ncbi:unnamed protein product [Urochloa humidicola]
MFRKMMVPVKMMLAWQASSKLLIEEDQNETQERGHNLTERRSCSMNNGPFHFFSVCTVRMLRSWQLFFARGPWH